MISDEYEEDLDDLGLKEFKSADSDDDEGDVYEVADQLGTLGNSGRLNWSKTREDMWTKETYW